MKRSTRKFLIFLIGIVAAVFLIWGGAQYISLRNRNKELEEQKEKLEALIEEELERAAELEDEEEYIKTIDYIEERARAIGYVYPDEIIFKKDE